MAKTTLNSNLDLDGDYPLLLDPKVRQRLRLLKRAEELGNIVQACEEMGVPRTLFYRYRKRYEQDGVSGLQDRPPVHKSHPQAKALEDIEMLKELAIEFPYDGLVSLSQRLWKRGGDSCSAMTVRKILQAHQLDAAERQRLHLERYPLLASKPESPSRYPIKYQPNLAYKESHHPARSPGEKLCQFVFLLRRCGSLGQVYVHVVVDTYTSMAWARLASAKSVVDALSLLEEEVLPLYALPEEPEPERGAQEQGPQKQGDQVTADTLGEEKGEGDPKESVNNGSGQSLDSEEEEPEEPNTPQYSIGGIQTSNSRLFRHSLRAWKADPRRATFLKAQRASYEAEIKRLRRKLEDNQGEGAWEEKKIARYNAARAREEAHGWPLYQDFLLLHDIDYLPLVGRNLEKRGANFNGFAEQLHHTMRSEFFTTARRSASGLTLEGLQWELDVWLKFYNEERPHPFYPNQGEPPAIRFKAYKAKIE